MKKLLLAFTLALSVLFMGCDMQNNDRDISVSRLREIPSGFIGTWVDIEKENKIEITSTKFVKSIGDGLGGWTANGTLESDDGKWENVTDTEFKNALSTIVLDGDNKVKASFLFGPTDLSMTKADADVTSKTDDLIGTWGDDDLNIMIRFAYNKSTSPWKIYSLINLWDATNSKLVSVASEYTEITDTTFELKYGNPGTVQERRTMSNVVTATYDTTDGTYSFTPEGGTKITFYKFDITNEDLADLE